MALLRLTILGVLLAAATAQGDVQSRLRHSELPRQIGLAGSDDGQVTSQVFIVQLASPAAAEFHATSAPRVSVKTEPGALLSTLEAQGGEDGVVEG